MKGRVINGGQVSGQAFVLDTPFSFIGDFDPETGNVTIDGHPLSGRSLAGKVLVCPTGKGGTIAPFIAYQAKKNGVAPAAIVCLEAEPLLCECALVIDIPMLDRFDSDLFEVIKMDQSISIRGEEVHVG